MSILMLINIILAALTWLTLAELMMIWMQISPPPLEPWLRDDMEYDAEQERQILMNLQENGWDPELVSDAELIQRRDAIYRRNLNEQ